MMFSPRTRLDENTLHSYVYTHILSNVAFKQHKTSVKVYHFIDAKHVPTYNCYDFQPDSLFMSQYIFVEAEKT
jgi:hypothetical protein